MTNETETMNQTIKAAREKEAKYLTFALAEEEYGIGILKVKEIIGMMQITSVPQTPVFVKGVINLRGKVIPVVDLRLKFGMPEINYTERTCIIVVEAEGERSDTQMGIVVDAVSEVLNIRAEDIEDTPKFGAALNTDFIMGMAKTEGGVKILLDIDKVLSRQEFETFNAAKYQSAEHWPQIAPDKTEIRSQLTAATEQAANVQEQPMP
jgi:purine-binding chemotaxis protein CheW